MKLHRGLLALLLACAIPAGPASALPHWSSDQIRAARPLAAEGAMAFDLRTETIESGKPSKVVLTTVTLAPTFSEATSGQGHVVEDHSLCRTFTWNEAARVVGDSSCYALPAFRVIELRNRQVLATTLAKADSPQASEPYWDEANLGLQLGDEKRLVAYTSGAATEYRLGKAVPVKITGIAGSLTPDEMGRFVRYLARNASLHPQVRRDIAERGALPAQIESQDAALGIRRSTRVMTLSNLRRETVSYPLPAGLPSEVRVSAAKGTTHRDAAIRNTLLAIDGRPGSPKPTLRELLDGIKATQNPMQAYLSFMNTTQQYAAEMTGPDSRTIINEIGPSIRIIMQNPDVAQFERANGLAGDARAAGNREASARYLAEARDLNYLRFGTFRNVTYANLARSTRDTKTWDPSIAAAMSAQVVDNYWIHIAAYPWASNAFTDAGDAYFESFDTPDAWLAYDLGRAVDPEWRSGVMARVGVMEADLRARHPEFF